MTFQLKTVRLKEKGAEIVMFGLVLSQFQTGSIKRSHDLTDLNLEGVSIPN